MSLIRCKTCGMEMHQEALETHNKMYHEQPKQPAGFPKEFKACPHCGCNQVIIGPLIAAEAEKGNWPKGVVGASRQQALMLRDPQRAALIHALPAAIIAWDICDECGYEYIRRVDVTDVPVKVNMQNPQGKPIDPRMLKR